MTMFEKIDLDNLISSLSNGCHKIVNTCYDNPDGTGRKWELLQVQMDRSSLNTIIEALKEKKKNV